MSLLTETVAAIVQASARILREVATFDSAGVMDKA